MALSLIHHPPGSCVSGWLWSPKFGTPGRFFQKLDIRSKIALIKSLRLLSKNPTHLALGRAKIPMCGFKIKMCAFLNIDSPHPRKHEPARGKILFLGLGLSWLNDGLRGGQRAI